MNLRRAPAIKSAFAALIAQAIPFAVVFCCALPAAAELETVPTDGALRSVHLVADPYASAATVALYIPVGEADRLGPEGGAHYLEHIMLWAADRAVGEGVKDRQINAWTSNLWTAYLNVGPNENVADLLLQSRAIFDQPVIDDAFMNSERDVILREYDLVMRGGPKNQLREAAFAGLFGDGALGRSLIGTPDSIEELSIVELLDWRSANYDAGSAHLLVYGDISIADLTSQVDRIFTGLTPTERPERRLAPRTMASGQGESEMRLDALARPAAFRAAWAPAPQAPLRQNWIAAQLLNDILNGPDEGGFLKPLYYDDFVVAEIGVDIALPDETFATMAIAFSPEDGWSAKDAASKVEATLRQLAVSGVSRRLFDEVKARTLESIDRGNAGSPRYSFQLAERSLLALNKPVSVADYREMIADAEVEDLNKLLRALASDGASFTVFGSPGNDL